MCIIVSFLKTYEGAKVNNLLQQTLMSLGETTNQIKEKHFVDPLPPGPRLPALESCHRITSMVILFHFLNENRNRNRGSLLLRNQSVNS